MENLGDCMESCKKKLKEVHTKHKKKCNDLYDEYQLKMKELNDNLLENQKKIILFHSKKINDMQNKLNNLRLMSTIQQQMNNSYFNPFSLLSNNNNSIDALSLSLLAQQNSNINPMAQLLSNLQNNPLLLLNNQHLFNVYQPI